MSIKRSLAWMGTAQVAVFLIQFTASVVIARYLTPHEFGIFAVGAAAVAILSLIQGMGLQALIVREPVLTKSILSTAFTINAAIAVALSLATILLAYVGGSFFREDGVRKVLLVLAIGPLLGIPSFLPAAQLEREGRFKKISLNITLMNVVSAVGTIAFAMLGYKYMSLAYAGVFSAIGLSLGFILMAREHFSCRLGISEWRRVTHFGLQMLAVTGIKNISQKLSDLALGRILGLSALGLYNRASGLNGVIWGNIHSLASRIVLVDFARIHREGASLRERYTTTVAMVTATLWPAFAGLAIVAKPFIFYVYGANWVSAALPLTYLAIASLINVSTTMSWEVCTVTGSLAAQTRIEAIRAPLSLAIFVAACFISIEAAAASRIIDAIVGFALYRPLLDRLTDTRYREFKKIFAQSLVVTLGAIAPAALLMLSTPGNVPSEVALLAAISMGIAIWASLLFAMQHPISIEVIASVRHRFAWARA